MISQYHLAHDDYTTILPVQIRLHKDRIQLIRNLLESMPGLYARRDLLVNLTSKLLGMDAESDRSKITLLCFMAMAALSSNDHQYAFTLCHEVIDLVKRARELDIDVSHEVSNIISQIAIIKEPRRLFLLSQALLLSSNDTFTSLILVWRNVLSEVSLSGAPEEITTSGKSQDTFILLENLRLSNMSSFPPQTVMISDMVHEFYKPVGSAVDNTYSSSFFNQDQPCILESNISFLRAQNSLRQLDGLSQDTGDYHSLSIAKELVNRDFPLAISYLFSSKMNNQTLLDFFNQLDPTPVHISLAAYFFSLKAVASVMGQTYCPITEADCLAIGVEELYARASTFFGSLEDQMEVAEALELMNIADIFGSMIKSSHSNQLLEILVTALGADLERLNSDERYRMTMILQLSHNVNSKTLNSAILLSEQYGIKSDELWASHFLWLFSTSNSTFSSVYDSTAQNTIQHFNAIIPILNQIHSSALQESNLKLAKIYQLLLDTNATSPFDVSQLNVRLSIINDLQRRALGIPFSRIIDSHQKLSEEYLRIWNDFGKSLGLIGFTSCLENWLKVKPLEFLSESFSQIENVPTLESAVVSMVIRSYVYSVCEDENSIRVALDEVHEAFRILLPEDLISLTHFLITAMNFSINTRIVILEKVKKQLGDYGDLKPLEEHVSFILNLQNLSHPLSGERIPATSIKIFDESFGKIEKTKDEIKSLLITGSSVQLVEYVCESFGLNSMSIISKIVTDALSEHDFNALRIVVESISKENQTSSELKFGEEDGWKIDDDLLLESSPEIESLPNISQSIQRILELYSLDEKSDSSFMLKVMELLKNVNFHAS